MKSCITKIFLRDCFRFIVIYIIQWCTHYSKVIVDISSSNLQIRYFLQKSFGTETQTTTDNQNLLNDKTQQRSFLEEISQKLKYNTMEDWYNIEGTVRNFLENSILTLLAFAQTWRKEFAWSLWQFCFALSYVCILGAQMVAMEISQTASGILGKPSQPPAISRLVRRQSWI